MSDASDRRRARIRAYVICPLPFAVGLLTGTAYADTAVTQLRTAAVAGHETAISLADSGHLTAVPLGGRGYSATPKPKAVANLFPNCNIVDDAFSTLAQQALSGNVLANDGPAGAIAAVASITPAVHGTVIMDVLADADNGVFTYTPDPGFSGSDSFTYTPEAAPPSTCRPGNSVGTVTITIIPVATADTFNTFVHTSLSGNVLANDIGSHLAVVGNTQPTHGSASVAANGSFNYLPQTGFIGLDTFQYTIEDAAAGRSSASVTLRVAAAPPPPTPVPAAGAGALGLLAALLAGFGLRRRHES